MGGFFNSAAQNGFFGGAPGAYATNDKFRSGVNDFLLGTDSSMDPYNQQSLSSLMKLLNGGGLQNNQTFQGGNNFLQSLFSNDPNAFAAFEAPFKRQFNEETVPGIAERFAGVGAGRSSGLNQALGRASENLSTNLAGLRGNMQMQALPQAYQYAQGPLQNILQAAGLIPGQYYETPGQEGFLQSGLNALVGGFAGGFGSSYGKRLGAG